MGNQKFNKDINCASFELDQFLIDAIGITEHLKWKNFHSSSSSNFEKSGFVILPNGALNQRILLKGFQKENKYTVNTQDFDEESWPSNVSSEVVLNLNGKHDFFNAPPADTKAHIEMFLSVNKSLIEEELGSHFFVSNIRFDSLIPGASYGPSNWHRDGGPSFLRKILIYPGPLAKSISGAFEFFDRDGTRHLLESDGSVALLYDTSILIHRGHPPQSASRPMIEITICPSSVTDVKTKFSGHLARVPKMLNVRVAPNEVKNHLSNFASLHGINKNRLRNPVSRGRAGKMFQRIRNIKSSSEFALLVLKKIGIRKVFPFIDLESKLTGPIPVIDGQISNNRSYLVIKNGNRFQYPGWFDLKTSCSGLSPYNDEVISPDITFPILSNSCHLVVMENTLGHYDDGQVFKIFAETKRVLNNEGLLVVILPNYFNLLMDLKSSANMNLDVKWRDVVDRGLPQEVNWQRDISLLSLFCSFKIGNALSADAFSADPDFFTQFAAHSDSPHEVAAAIKAHIEIENKPKNYVFQNAWSADELIMTLQNTGFHVSQPNRKEFQSKFSWLPEKIHFDQKTDLIIVAKK